MTVKNGEDSDKIGYFEDDDGAGVIRVYGPGNVTLKVTCNDSTVTIPFTIVRLPINDGDRKDAIVNVLGLPDKQTTKFIAYPDDAVFDGVLYFSGHHVDGVSLEHWMCNKYPGAILETGGYTLGDFLKQASWASLEKKMFDLKHTE